MDTNELNLSQLLCIPYENGNVESKIGVVIGDTALFIGNIGKWLTQVTLRYG